MVQLVLFLFMEFIATVEAFISKALNPETDHKVYHLVSCGVVQTEILTQMYFLYCLTSIGGQYCAFSFQTFFQAFHSKLLYSHLKVQIF